MIGTNQILAAAAALLALGALVAGDARRPAVAPQDQVSAVQLAEWIRARNQSLRIIDVRDSASFNDFQIPTAEHVAAHDIARAEFGSADLIVLYDNDGDSPKEWALLKARGLNVLVLQDGLGGWLNDIMNPQLPATASAEQVRAYQRKKDLAEYFGGQASAYSEPGALSPSTLQSLKRMKRRTC